MLRSITRGKENEKGDRVRQHETNEKTITIRTQVLYQECVMSLIKENRKKEIIAIIM